MVIESKNIDAKNVVAEKIMKLGDVIIDSAGSEWAVNSVITNSNTSITVNLGLRCKHPKEGVDTQNGVSTCSACGLTVRPLVYETA